MTDDFTEAGLGIREYQSSENKNQSGENKIMRNKILRTMPACSGTSLV
jgi:hypothetical protein